VYVVAVKASDPVLEVGATAHAFCMREEVEGGGAVGETGGFDVGYFLAGWNYRLSDVGVADFLYCLGTFISLA
jgi:hypothetical protein